MYRRIVFQEKYSNPKVHKELDLKFLDKSKAFRERRRPTVLRRASPVHCENQEPLRWDFLSCPFSTVQASLRNRHLADRIKNSNRRAPLFHRDRAKLSTKMSDKSGAFFLQKYFLFPSDFHKPANIFR